MTVPPDRETGAIGLAEKILTLLDQGRFTATYKYAVLLGLMDLCLEGTSHEGDPPAVVTTRQLAEKVIELYWPHTVPYSPSEDVHVLRQIQVDVNDRRRSLRQSRISGTRPSLGHGRHSPASSWSTLRDSRGWFTK